MAAAAATDEAVRRKVGALGVHAVEAVAAAMEDYKRTETAGRARAHRRRLTRSGLCGARPRGNEACAWLLRAASEEGPRLLFVIMRQ